MSLSPRKYQPRNSKDFSQQRDGVLVDNYVNIYSVLYPFSSPVSCERQRVEFLGDSSRRSCKFWIFSWIMAERCRPLWPLWASATLPVSKNLATQRWIALLSGTLFLPKSLLLCHCVRRTDFVAKYASIVFICYRIV